MPPTCHTCGKPATHTVSVATLDGFVCDAQATCRDCVAMSHDLPPADSPPYVGPVRDGAFVSAYRMPMCGDLCVEVTSVEANAPATCVYLAVQPHLAGELLALSAELEACEAALRADACALGIDHEGDAIGDTVGAINAMRAELGTLRELQAAASAFFVAWEDRESSGWGAKGQAARWRLRVALTQAGG